MTFSKGLVYSVSWLGQLTVGVQITDYFNSWVSKFLCYLVWAVDLGVQITDVGESLYIGSFFSAITSLSRYLEEAAFSISIFSSVFIFLCFFFKVYYGHSSYCCFHFMFFLKDMFREFGF